jgi:sodium/potassium-transporting ATPase subunit alpha
VCVAIGDNTVFGRIAKLTSDPNTAMTPLQKEIFRFVMIISIFIACVVLLIIILWYVTLAASFHGNKLNSIQGGMAPQILP